MVLYKTLYRRKCKSPFHWDEIGERCLGIGFSTEINPKNNQRCEVNQREDEIDPG